MKAYIYIFFLFVYLYRARRGEPDKFRARFGVWV